MSSLLKDTPFWHLSLKMNDINVNKIISWHFKLTLFFCHCFTECNRLLVNGFLQKKIQQSCTSLTFDNLAKIWGSHFPKLRALNVEDLVFTLCLNLNQLQGLFVCLGLFLGLFSFFVCLFLIEFDCFFPNLCQFQFLCINTQKQLLLLTLPAPTAVFSLSGVQHGSRPQLLSHSNLAALTCTKQGCRNDLHTITSCVSGQGISSWAAVIAWLSCFGCGRKKPVLCWMEEHSVGEEEEL